MDSEIERFDIISEQCELLKKVILNLLIIFKNLEMVGENDIINDIQNIRLLSISLTDIFINFKKVKDMKLRYLSYDEIHYIRNSLSNFSDMLLILLK